MAFPYPLDRSQILRRGTACAECHRLRVKCNGGRPECSPCAKHQRKCLYGADDEVPLLQKRVRQLEVQLQRSQREARSAASKASAHQRGDYAEAAGHPFPNPSPSTHPPISNYPALPQPPSLTLTPWHPPTLGNLVCPSNGLSSWDPNTEMPPLLRSDVLATFELLQPQLYIDLYLPRLRRMVLLSTASDQERCDPALWNAICLVVVSCYGPSAHQFERLFLDRLHYYGYQSVSEARHLEEFIVASVLEVYYLLHVGRVLEAHSRSSTLVRFAIACNLHRISDPADYIRETGLCQARDIFHVAEHINIWWSVYILAQKVAFLSGLPDGCPDFPLEKIDTVLPASFADVQKLGPAAWPPGSQLRDLFRPNSRHLDAKSNHLLLLSVKSIALFTRTASQAYRAAGTTFSEYCMLCSVSNNLLETTPRIDDPMGVAAVKTTLFGATLIGGQSTSPGQWYNPALLHVHIDLLCAALLLSTKFAHHERIATYNRQEKPMVTAARALAKIAPIVVDVSRLYVQFSLGPPMVAATDILVFEIQQYLMLRDINRLSQTRESLRNIMSFLPRLSGFFPEIGARVSAFQHLLAPPINSRSLDVP